MMMRLWSEEQSRQPTQTKDARTAGREAEGELWLLTQQDPAEAGAVGTPSQGREEEGLPGRPLL